MIDSVAGMLYHLLRGNTPDLVLKRLGIATPRRRIEFYTLDRLLRSMPEIPGSIVECGTYRGGTLLGMAHIVELRGFATRIFGLDSFEGFPEPTREDAQRDGSFHSDIHKGGLGDVSYQDLVARVRRLGFDPHVTLVKGYFEDTLPTLERERFSLAHLDCDLYQSYMTCFEFIYPRMLPGGFMVFDDYGSPVYLGADRAVNEFLEGKPEVLQYFPDAAGRRYFVRVGGGLAPGAVAATPAPASEQRPAS
jgi:hypothetical protein